MLKSIHFKAFAVWAIYTAVTKGSFLAGMSESVTPPNAYMINIIFSVIFGLLFLYLFSHQDFFKFAKEIEKNNSKAERRWEHRLLHFGRLFSAFLIGVATGPLIGALAIRFLVPRHKYKYVLIVTSSTISAILWLGLTRGAIIWRLPF